VDITTVEKIKDELAAQLTDRRFGKIFMLSRFELAIDFRLADSRYLFISVEPVDPRIYLIRRRVRDLEKQSANPSAFVQLLRKNLSGAVLEAIEQIEGERVLRLAFSGEDEIGIQRTHSLIVQLTGKSANLFLLNESRSIIDSLRDREGDGQERGTIYAPPERPAGTKAQHPSAFSPGRFECLSEALDAASLERKAENEFRALANTARSRIKQEISKREKLRSRLNNDLTEHGDAEQWKRFGDLLLANVSTAERRDSKIVVIDYFDENLARVEIEADENDSVTEAADKFFRKYTKARNAFGEIEKRLRVLDRELERLRAERDEIENAIENKDLDFLAALAAGAKQKEPEKLKGKDSPLSSIARSFASSDGFEILVGKKAKDNDYLTFRVAKSLDTWMHAADYPGSHVVIRNPNRKEIPPRTLLEAAELAAFYSQGKAQPKAAVHYTQKKFVNKPKGAVPGLVSLASFKTLLVEPRVSVELIR
jgi:predicted ribosome quality control (RQC) complex YloA/Tae2 family protein